MLPITGYFTIDTETSIGSGIHTSSSRDTSNDYYTFIYGTHPQHIKLLHKKQGFKRKIPYRAAKYLLQSKTLITQNGKFDMSYFWHDKYFQRWLKKGGVLWDIQVVRYILSYMRHQFPSLAEMQKIYLGVKTKQDRISYLFSEKKKDGSTKPQIGADKIMYAGRNYRQSVRATLSIDNVGGVLVPTCTFTTRLKAPCKRLWKLYLEYGIEDGRTPMLIFKEQYKEAKSRNMLPIIELFNAYLLSLTMIEVNGIPVNEHQLEINRQIIAIEELDYLQQAQELAKEHWVDPRLPPLNINSTDHKSVLLFGGTLNCKVRVIKGYTIAKKATKTKPAVESKPKYTTVLEDVYIPGFGLSTGYTEEAKKQGFYKTGEPIIEKIYAKSKNEKAKEFCKYMQLAANSRKMLSTYILGIKDRLVSGKLHPNYNNTKTVTTRLSSSSPNLQNVPAEGRYNELIQGLFTAPKGWTCASGDFSQLEVYVKAWLSNDLKLIKDLQDNVCLHCMRACWFPDMQKVNMTYDLMYHYAKVQEIPEYVKWRKKAKPIGFGKAYGKGYARMALEEGIPEPQMKEIYEKEDEMYWQAAEYDELNQRAVESNTKISYKADYAERDTRGIKNGAELSRRFSEGYELLPIKRAKGSKEYEYDRFEPRHIGIYRNPCGLELAVEEHATRTNKGDIYKYYLSTQVKNYPMQSGASIIQACTTVEMFQFLLRNPDKVLMVNEIHDSKWFLIKNEYLTCIVDILSTIMLNVGDVLKRRFGVETPLKFANDFKFGKTFSNMQSMKDYINSQGDQEWPKQMNINL